MGEWRYSATHSLTSVLDGGEWSASRPERFTPRERAFFATMKIQVAVLWVVTPYVDMVGVPRSKVKNV
jgi:hypothetical protein